MKHKTGFGVGSASLLIIFVLLCVTCFAVLSLSAARADLRLAERAAQATRDYYEADSRATARRAAIEQLVDSAPGGGGSTGYFRTLRALLQAHDPTLELSGEGRLVVQFTEPVDERRMLSVSLEFSRTYGKARAQSTLLQWRVITAGETLPGGMVLPEGPGLWTGEGGLLP